MSVDQILCNQLPDKKYLKQLMHRTGGSRKNIITKKASLINILIPNKKTNKLIKI